MKTPPVGPPVEKAQRTVLLSRRAVLAAFGAAVGSAALLAACGDDGDGADADADAGTAGTDAGSAPDGGTASADGAPTSSTCEAIPDETAGPYPDTKGMIADEAFYRSDITEDREGVPLTLTLTLVNVGASCAAIVGAHVEIWHCDASGVYSEYANTMNPGSTATTYLRGVQTSDANGQVTFQTIYPGWYQGRVTHIHIQVFSGTSLVKTTQIGFPDSVNEAVYAVAPYAEKGQNPIGDDDDQVFGDGHDLEIASITGNTANGYLATIAVGLASFA